MKEQDYQTKIIKSIEAIGGIAINGNFTKAGTADLICGYPIAGILHHVHIEVKTPYDYDRVFRAIDEEDGYYKFKDDVRPLKKHEYLQITKLNSVRKLGGLALVAYDIKQVQEYINDNRNSKI